VNNYKNSLSAIMRKEAGVDVKFYSWCKTHFKIVVNADMELLCSAKDGRRVAVREDYYQVTRSPNTFTVRRALRIALDFEGYSSENWPWRSR